MTSVHGPSPSAPVFTNLEIQATHPPLVREQTQKYPTGPCTPNLAAVPLDAVVIGWKDTRETRRAVVDALPLLRHAGRVAVVEVASEEDLPAARTRLDDVVAWLKRHGVVAHSVAAPAAGDDATRLDGIVLEHGAGLLVAGAYGHNRLREWTLGGVTRTVLKHPGRCSLLSH